MAKTTWWGGQVRNYAVLSGGGIRGLALAGALKAADLRTLEFQGYGGSSIGAIVALLAAADHSPDEIRAILEAAALDRATSDALKKIESTWTLLQALSFGGRSSWGLMTRLRDFFNVAEVRTAIERFGILDQSVIRKPLLEALSSRFPSEDVSRMSFERFRELTGTTLKVVATDLSKNRPVVFGPRPQTRLPVETGYPVVDAVCASASYPIAFQPMVINDMVLVDGGLSSNIPSFLFQEEVREARGRTFVFYLVDDNTPSASPPPEANLLRDFLYSLGRTAVSASDVFIGQLSQRNHRIPIRVRSSIRTFGSGLDGIELENLFNKGHVDAHEGLFEIPYVKRMMAAGRDRNKMLVAEYRPVAEVEPLLEAFRHKIADVVSTLQNLERDEVPLFEREQSFRAALFVPYSTEEDTWQMAYHVGFNDGGSEHADIDLVVGKNSPGVGEAIRERRIATIKFDDIRRADLADHDPLLKVPRDRIEGVMIPIFADRTAWDGDAVERLPVICVLTIDAPMSFFSPNEPESDISDPRPTDELEKIFKEWSCIISRVIAG